MHTERHAHITGTGTSFLYNAACVYACVFSASGCIGEHVRLERHIPLHSVYAWLYMYACTYKVGTHYTHNIPGMMYTCSYKYIYICMYMYMSIYVYIYIYLYIYACIYILYIYIYIYIHVPHTVLFAGAQPWDVGVLAFAAEPSALSCWQPMCDTYVYIYAHIYIHITHIYNTWTRASYTYIFIYAHIHACMYIFIYFCTYSYTYTGVYVCAYIHVCTDMSTRK